VGTWSHGRAQHPVDEVDRGVRRVHAATDDSGAVDLQCVRRAGDVDVASSTGAKSVKRPPMSVSTRVTFGLSLPLTARHQCGDVGWLDAAVATGSAALPATEPAQLDSACFPQRTLLEGKFSSIWSWKKLPADGELTKRRCTSGETPEATLDIVSSL